MNHCKVVHRVCAAGVIAMSGLVGCGPKPAPTTSAPINVAPVAPAGSESVWEAGTGLIDLAPGPVVQFERSCARCHGPQGSLFDKGLSQMDVRGLRREVVEMMAGPGELHPSAGQVRGMTAYVEAIREGKPFVTVDNAASFSGGQQVVLQGEATAGTKVEIRQAGLVTPVVVTGPTWRASNPPLPPFTIVGTRGDRQVSFPFPLQQWSTPPHQVVPATTQNIPFPSGTP